MAAPQNTRLAEASGGWLARLWVLALFDVDPDPEVLRQRILVEDSELTRYCAAIVADHARRYGWSVRQRNAVIQSLRILQTLRPTPTGHG